MEPLPDRVDLTEERCTDYKFCPVRKHKVKVIVDYIMSSFMRGLVYFIHNELEIVLIFGNIHR